MRRMYRVNSKEFEYLASSGYKIGEYTDEILKWIHENVKAYQLYSIEGHYSENGYVIIAEVLVYEEEVQYE